MGQYNQHTMSLLLKHMHHFPKRETSSWWSLIFWTDQGLWCDNLFSSEPVVSQKVLSARYWSDMYFKTGCCFAELHFVLWGVCIIIGTWCAMRRTRHEVWKPFIWLTKAFVLTILVESGLLHNQIYFLYKTN